MSAHPLDTLVFATSNPGKAAEASAFLGRGVEATPLDLPEIQSASFLDVVREKARVAAARLGVPVLVEDSGLRIAAWGGFPGPFTKWLAAAAGLDGFARMLDASSDRSAEAVSALAVARPGQDPADILAVEAAVAGAIAARPRGTAGFGWDVLFVPEGETRTFAEMSAAEKNARSHRARAFEALRRALAPRG